MTADDADAEPAPRRPALGALLLLTAAIVWGFAFVPQKLSVVSLPPLSATALRFLLALPLPLLLARGRLRAPGIPTRHALLLGALLFVIYVLQTAALTLTPVARVSLITGLYAVFVPLFAPLMRAPRATPLHWLGAALAFVGLFGLVGVVRVVDDAAGAPLNWGDLLVLVHAVLSAFQILLVGRFARRADPFALNALQLTSVTVLAVIAALIVDPWPDLGALDGRTWGAFLYLALVSTVVAFTCQIVGQRHASPSTAAVVMLIETPVGVLGALLVFDEAMSPSQWLGAGVLFVGVVVSLVAEELAARRMGQTTAGA